MKKLIQSFCLLSALATFSSFAETSSERTPHGRSYFSDEKIPFLYANKEDDPGRTAPFFGLELGDKFLGNGNLAPGFTIPTGAVWQPRLWIYGNSRTAIQSYDLGGNQKRVSEWATRLDLFANLQLTGTERILLGLQPLHRGNQFYGHQFSPDSQSDFRNPTNLNIRTLFFEGDFAEVFPFLDRTDGTTNDIGFSFGRQNLVFQDGLILNDSIDAIGLTKNNIRFDSLSWLTNLRITTLVGLNEVNRNDNVDDDSAKLYGIFTATDTLKSTIEADVIYVDGDDSTTADLLVWGLGNIQRLGHYNWTMRYAGSAALDRETAQSSDGHLLFTEISWTPHATVDLVYLNGFVGIDDFSSAARDDIAGGPLGRTGLLFAARGLGSYPAPLSNRASNAFGAAMGYQMFFFNNRHHLIGEVGYRRATEKPNTDLAGAAVQYQMSFAKRYIFQVDAFVTAQENDKPANGLRTEFQIKF